MKIGVAGPSFDNEKSILAYCLSEHLQMKYVSFDPDEVIEKKGKQIKKAKDPIEYFFNLQEFLLDEYEKFMAEVPDDAIVETTPLDIAVVLVAGHPPIDLSKPKKTMKVKGFEKRSANLLKRCITLSTTYFNVVIHIPAKNGATAIYEPFIEHWRLLMTGLISSCGIKAFSLPRDREESIENYVLPMVEKIQNSSSIPASQISNLETMDCETQTIN